MMNRGQTAEPAGQPPGLCLAPLAQPWVGGGSKLPSSVPRQNSPGEIGAAPPLLYFSKRLRVRPVLLN